MFPVVPQIFVFFVTVGACPPQPSKYPPNHPSTTLHNPPKATSKYPPDHPMRFAMPALESNTIQLHCTVALYNTTVPWYCTVPLYSTTTQEHHGVTHASCACRGPTVRGLTEKLVHSWEEIEALLDAGMDSRTTAATAMNDKSSRSHAVVQLSLDMETQLGQVGAKKISRPRRSRANLVDLAGSEKVRHALSYARTLAGLRTLAGPRGWRAANRALLYHPFSLIPPPPFFFALSSRLPSSRPTAGGDRPNMTGCMAPPFRFFFHRGAFWQHIHDTALHNATRQETTGRATDRRAHSPLTYTCCRWGSPKWRAPI